jgi:hypothetical protein
MLSKTKYLKKLWKNTFVNTILFKFVRNINIEDSRKNNKMGKYISYFVSCLYVLCIFIAITNVDIMYKTYYGLHNAEKCWETPVKTLLSEEQYEKFKEITGMDSLQMRNSSKTYTINQCSFEFYIEGNTSVVKDCFKYATVSNTTIQLLHTNNASDVVITLAKEFNNNKDLASLNHLYVKDCIKMSLKGPIYNTIETYLFRSIRFFMEIGFTNHSIFYYCYLPLQCILFVAILVINCKKSKKD